LAGVALTGVVAGGTYLSKEKFLGVVHEQAEEVLNTNNGLLEEISRRLASGKNEDYKRIGEIQRYLQNQRASLPQLSIIYSGKFEDKTAFYRIDSYYPYESESRPYNPVYFPCTKNLDCEYLTRFFSSEKVNVLRKSSFPSDQFFIYIPYTGSEARFVLFFDRRNSYGKLGS